MGAYKPIILLNNSDADREKWLDIRMNYVSSTESSCFWGMNKYSSLYQMWHNKKDLINEDFDDERMKVGRFIEPAIAALVLDELGCNGTPFKQYLAHPDVRAGSSFDWKITSGKYKGWLLEIKNVDQWIFRDNWIFNESGFEDEAPSHIEIQVQHQMAISGRKGTIIAALVGGNKLNLIFRERDDEMRDMILEETNTFWDSIEQNIEPQPNFEVDDEFIARFQRKSGGNPFIACGADPIGELIKEDDALKAANNKIAKRRKEIKAESFLIIGDADSLMIDGRKARSCKNIEDKENTFITDDMVGNEVKGRKGYRNFR